MHTGTVYTLPLSPTSSLPSNMVVVDTFTADMAGVLPLTNAFSPTGGLTTLNLQVPPPPFALSLYHIL